MGPMSLPQKLRVVLHQTQGADNLGAVARLCANFGVAELWLAETHLPDLEAARPMAVHAGHVLDAVTSVPTLPAALEDVDRKSTRLNSSHVKISYAVFCLKKKKRNIE